MAGFAPRTALACRPIPERRRAVAALPAPRPAGLLDAARVGLPRGSTGWTALGRPRGGDTAWGDDAQDGRPSPRRSSCRGRRAGSRSPALRSTGLLPISVVLGAHALARHSSCSLLGETVLFYQALPRVLGNDKRFTVELPNRIDTTNSSLTRAWCGMSVTANARNSGCPVSGTLAGY